jgi:hypothetical protein
VRVRNLDGSSFTVDGSGQVEATAPSTPA